MELLDVLDEDGNVIGVEDRSVVHEKGLWHIHVGVWIMNEKGELLFQKRAINKKRNPNKWTRTGGHVDSGETPIIGIQREVEEEIGVKIPQDKFELISIEKLESDKKNRQFTYNYFAYVNYKIEEYTMQEEEVSDLKYISIEEMEKLKRENNQDYTFVKWDTFDEKISMLKKMRHLGQSQNVSKEDFMRKKVIAGNWKMNMLPNEAIDFIEKLATEVKNTNNEVVLCVPYTDLFYALLTAQETNIKIGAQNMHFEESGAYTGEVSGKMLKSIGVEYVIIGHSERRQYFNETDETVNKKIKAAFANDLKPIVCVGETLEEREANRTEEIITTQTELALQGLTAEQVEKTIIAYEPIWAIGTGKTATAEDANNSIKAIRDKICQIYGQTIANGVIIQYGGSVKGSNAKELFEMSDIDGGLVGGASLKPDEFAKIVNYNK